MDMKLRDCMYISGVPLRKKHNYYDVSNDLALRLYTSSDEMQLYFSCGNTAHQPVN
jgi:hypothetical protein